MEDKLIPAQLAPLVREIKQRAPGSLAVCGAGDVGRVLIAYLKNELIVISCVTDRDTARHGQSLEGIAICSLDEAVARGVTVFALGSLGSKDAMRADVQAACAARGVTPEIFAP